MSQAFIECSQALPTMQLYGPKSSTIENKTCWVTGPSCTGSVISPNVVVVKPLKLERIHPAKFNISEESYIWLKAGSYNKSAALPGSSSTMCTSKSLIQRVRTSAS